LSPLVMPATPVKIQKVSLLTKATSPSARLMATCRRRAAKSRWLASVGLVWNRETVMKQQQWMMALCCLFALWGCKPTDNTIQVGTYEGVVWSDDTLPLSAQVVVQNSATLLTLW